MLKLMKNQIQQNDLIQENVNLNEDTGKKRRKKQKQSL